MVLVHGARVLDSGRKSVQTVTIICHPATSSSVENNSVHPAKQPRPQFPSLTRGLGRVTLYTSRWVCEPLVPLMRQFDDGLSYTSLSRLDTGCCGLCVTVGHDNHDRATNQSSSFVNGDDTGSAVSSGPGHEQPIAHTYSALVFGHVPVEWMCWQVFFLVTLPSTALTGVGGPVCG
jgi:hypothetical protein